MATYSPSRRRISSSVLLGRWTGLCAVVGMVCVLAVPTLSIAQQVSIPTPPVSTIPPPSPSATIVVPAPVTPAPSPTLGTPTPILPPPVIQTFGEALGADPSFVALTARLEAMEKSLNELKAMLGTSPALVRSDPPGSAVKVPTSGDAPADDQQGIALFLLLPELDQLQSSWNSPQPPTAAEVSSPEKLTAKILGWNQEIRTRVTSVETVATKIKANELVLGETSLKLDENTLALSKAKFNISWATANSDSVATAQWTKTQAKLKGERTAFTDLVKKCHSELISQIEQSSRLKKEIVARTQDVDLANTILSLIKAAAPIPGPPLP